MYYLHDIVSVTHIIVIIQNMWVRLFKDGDVLDADIVIAGNIVSEFHDLEEYGG